MAEKKIVSALRVAQLDTEQLDRNAERLLTSQLQACFKYNLMGYDLMLIEPHFRSLMYVFLLYFTLWDKGQTIGQKLLRVRYAESKTFTIPSQKKLLFMHGVLALQFWADATKSHGRQWFSKSKKINIFLKYIESSFSLLSFFNFLVFLRQGHFQSMLHRLAGLRTVYIDPDPRRRNISYDLISREILWQGFAETGVFFLSLINVSKLRRKVSELFYSHPQDKLEIHDSCGFCHEIPIMPCTGACGKHVYCYYCVTTVLVKDEGAKCPACNVELDAVNPLKCREFVIN